MSELIIEVKKHYDRRYSTIFLGPVEDPELSWKAKGIFIYLRSRPPSWKIRTTDLYNRSTNGRESVTAGLQELEKFGYLYREQSRNPEGKFTKVIYHLYDEPDLNDHFIKNNSTQSTPTEQESPDTGNPLTVKPPPYYPTVLIENNKPPTNQNELITNNPPLPKNLSGCHSHSDQENTERRLIDFGVNPKIASSLSNLLDFETVDLSIKFLDQTPGIYNPPGLLISRLNNIIKKDHDKIVRNRNRLAKQNRESIIKQKENLRLSAIRDKNIDDFSLYLKKHPNAGFFEFINSTSIQVKELPAAKS